MDRSFLGSTSCPEVIGEGRRSVNEKEKNSTKQVLRNRLSKTYLNVVFLQQPDRHQLTVQRFLKALKLTSILSSSPATNQPRSIL